MCVKKRRTWVCQNGPSVKRSGPDWISGAPVNISKHTIWIHLLAGSGLYLPANLSWGIGGGYSVRKAPRKGLFRTDGLMQSQTGRVGGVGGNRRDEQSSGVQRGRGNRETGGRCRRWALGDRGSVGRSQSGFYHLRVSNKRLAAPLGEYRHLTRDDNYVPIFWRNIYLFYYLFRRITVLLIYLVQLWNRALIHDQAIRQVNSAPCILSLCSKLTLAYGQIEFFKSNPRENMFLIEFEVSDQEAFVFWEKCFWPVESFHFFATATKVSPTRISL